MPANDVAIGINRTAHFVDSHWAVIAARQIVFTGPDQFPGPVTPGGLGNRTDFIADLSRRLSAAAKGTTREHDVQRHILDRQAEGARNCLPVKTGELVAAPSFGAALFYLNDSV